MRHFNFRKTDGIYVDSASASKGSTESSSSFDWQVSRSDIRCRPVSYRFQVQYPRVSKASYGILLGQPTGLKGSP
jgi:hypothetical protein